ncbi:MAG: fibronectin type III domain-containing protein [Lachnospiraceae bacterium]
MVFPLAGRKLTKADTYVVYRFSGSGKPKKIGTTKKLTYMDTKGSCSHRIQLSGKSSRCQRSNVYEGDASKSVDVITTVGKVKTLKASVTSPDLMNAKVTLKWSSVSGADGYYVYQAAGKGKMKLVNDVEGDTSCVVEDVDFSASTTYRYQVRAYTRYNKEEKSGTASADVKVSKAQGTGQTGERSICCFHKNKTGFSEMVCLCRCRWI